MSATSGVAITTLSTGISGLDSILGGGLPEYSFNLIIGTPGAGKTTLSHQLMFALASAERPALYFTVLGEPRIKMLRYQQQMAFFDAAKLETSIHFQDLSDVVLEQDLGKMLEHIVRRVEEVGPGLVIVDSFQTVMRASSSLDPGRLDLQSFVQRLAVHGTAELREGVRRPTLPGLTDEEEVVLHALLELGEAPAETLAARTGLRGDDLAIALDRLVRLHYAERRQEANGLVYRAVARAMG